MSFPPIFPFSFSRPIFQTLFPSILLLTYIASTLPLTLPYSPSFPFTFTIFFPLSALPPNHSSSTIVSPSCHSALSYTFPPLFSPLELNYNSKILANVWYVSLWLFTSAFHTKTSLPLLVSQSFLLFYHPHLTISLLSFTSLPFYHFSLLLPYSLPLPYFIPIISPLSPPSITLSFIIMLMPSLPFLPSFSHS